MLREHLLRAHPERDGIFRWRGDGVSRIEGLSDAVFGFAVTLLVVSLEVPRSFAELAQTMRGFVAFAASFVLLALMWHSQYKFFRRYGLEDGRTILLNVVLLFVVLFYIYPLKFLFGTLVPMAWAAIAGRAGLPRDFFGTPMAGVEAGEWPVLMTIYGVGFAVIYLIFALLHWHAWAQRDALGLDAVERLATRHGILEHVINCALGVASVVIVLVGAYALHLPPGKIGLYGGMIYTLTGPLQAVHWTLFQRRVPSLVAARDAERAAAAPAVAATSA